MATSAPSLYDDWVERRRRSNELSELKAPLRVLDYLLERYRDDPVAQNTARFPVPSEVFFDRRAILVLRHVALSQKPALERSADASVRASRILQRIQAQAPQESMQAPAGGAVVGSLEMDPLPSRLFQQNRISEDPRNALRMQLLSEYPQERVDAAFALADVGTLDDVNLLLDLLSLTPPVETSGDGGSPPNIDNIEVDIPDISILEALLKRTIAAAKPYVVINERELLEACAMRLAQKEHTPA